MMSSRSVDGPRIRSGSSLAARDLIETQPRTRVTPRIEVIRAVPLSWLIQQWHPLRLEATWRGTQPPGDGKKQRKLHLGTRRNRPIREAAASPKAQ